jgi:sugar phosphate isomerase/epimerase
MDTSFSTSAGGDNAWSLDECARWAKDNAFESIRLSTSGIADSDKVLKEGPDEIKNTLEANNVYLAALSAHNNLLDDDEEQADAAADRLRKAVESASILGTPIVVTHAGSPDGFRFYGQYSSPPGNASDRSIELVERFKKRFTPIVKLAEDRGVTIALDGAVRMGNIACNPQMWERVLEAIPSNHIGLSCDPSHWLWMMIMPAEDAIRMFAGKWVYADVKDAEVSKEMLFRQGIIGNSWWQYRVPGRGQLNWGTIIGALLESGYDYVLCVENEDRGMPGLAGFSLGGRHLRQFLPKKGEDYQRPSGFWKMK